MGKCDEKNDIDTVAIIIAIGYHERLFGYFWTYKT